MSRLFNDGANQYLQVDSTPITGDPFSGAAWFYSDDVTVDQYIVSIGDKDLEPYFYALRLRGTIGGDPLELFRWNGGGVDTTQTLNGVTANTWHHGCMVINADDDVEVFLDGDVANKGTDSDSYGQTGWDSIAIATSADSTKTNYFSGRICEVALWDAALTDAEVVALAVGIRPVFVRPSNLVFYLPLIRDDDEDLFGGLSLTANGGPTVAVHCPMYYTASGLASFGAAAGVVPALAMHHFRKRRSKN